MVTGQHFIPRLWVHPRDLGLVLPLPDQSGSELPLDLSQQQQVLRVSDVGLAEQLPVGEASVIVEVRRIEGEARSAVRESWARSLFALTSDEFQMPGKRSWWHCDDWPWTWAILR